MSMIYEPRGAAHEYSPLAFNYHAGKCSIGCKYPCYAASIVRGKPPVINREKIFADLEKSIRKMKPAQVLLNFLHDPYEPLCAPITPEVVLSLASSGFPVAILTKCMNAAWKDIQILNKIPLLKIGTTLTCNNTADSLAWEPGADTPEDRVDGLKRFHAAGIKTFVSFEPVIYPLQTLDLIGEVASYVDQIKIGRWNHSAGAKNINWKEFGEAAVSMARDLKLNFYVKNDLRAAMPGFKFTERESNYLLHEMKPYD